MMHTKAEVEFEHPAKGKDHCKDCKHFRIKEEKCEIVMGKIQPGDWCKLYESKID